MRMSGESRMRVGCGFGVRMSSESGIRVGVRGEFRMSLGLNVRNIFSSFLSPILNPPPILILNLTYFDLVQLS